MKNRYFDLMRQTSSEVNSEVSRYLNRFKKYKNLDELLQELPRKRAKKPQLRPFLMRLSYEICHPEKDWKKIIPALASMEIHNTYLYLHNWIFDNKNNVWNKDLQKTRKRVNNLLIAASLFREISEDALEKGFGSMNFKIREEALKDYRESLIKNYVGFYEDLNLLMDDFTKFKSDEEFIRAYRIKSENQSGNFYGLTSKLGAMLAGASHGEINSLHRFGFYLGSGLHISNDLGDFALPNKDIEVFCKPYQDQLADIKEGRLTLPIYFVLKYGDNQQKESLINMVGNYNCSKEQVENAVKSVIKSGAYDYCKKFAKGYYKKAKQILHNTFPASEKRDLLSVMISSIRTNKFLVELRNIGKDF